MTPLGTSANRSGIAAPRAPAARQLNASDLRDAHARSSFSSLLSSFDSAVYAQQIIDAAKRFIGAQTFGLGVAWGFVSYPVKEALSLVELTKTFVFADLYELIYRKDPWTAAVRGNMYGPGGFAAVLALRALRDVGGLEHELKSAHEQRDAILHELGEILSHPLDFAEQLPGKIKAEYSEKWRRAEKLRAGSSLSDQFEAGKIIGELLMEVLLTIIAVIDVAGVAVKLASKAPQLVRLARSVRLGGGAGASKAASAGARAAETSAQMARDTKVARVATEAEAKPRAPEPAKPSVTLAGVTAEERRLASSAEVSIGAANARRKVVESFLQTHGREWNGSGFSPPNAKQIASQMKGYDVAKPVHVGPPPPCPAKQVQWQRPNGNQGSYYADPGASPDSLGIADKASDANGNVVPKVQKTYQVDPDAPYIESTSAPVNDDWSVSGQSIPTNGGGTQRTIGDRALAKPI